MTFATAVNFVDDVLKQSGNDGKLQKHLADVAQPSMTALSNLATMFGFGSNKAAFNAVFGTCNDSYGNKHENVLWVRMVYWRHGICSMFNHIGRLRKQSKVKDQESKAAAEEPLQRAGRGRGGGLLLGQPWRRRNTQWWRQRVRWTWLLRARCHLDGRGEAGVCRRHATTANLKLAVADAGGEDGRAAPRDVAVASPGTALQRRGGDGRSSGLAILHAYSKAAN